MPANLPPEYREAEKRYRQARTVAEKIEALEHMLAVMPHHKGTDHLRAELRSKIARLSEEGQRQQGGARANLYSVRKEGAGQVVVLGPPNVGKSQLVATLTGAPLRVASYPFTTQQPCPAMLPYENIRIQLVDLPPVVADGTPGWVRPLVRQADLLLLVVDLAGDPLADLDTLLGELTAMRVEPVARAAPAPPNAWIAQKAALVVGNKLDAPDAAEVYPLLVEACAERFPTLAVSATAGTGLEALRHELFRRLDIVRVYTRAPGQPVDRTRPFVLRRGETLEALAEAIHKGWRDRLRYAQVWGAGKFQGQRVSRYYTPEDEDVVELALEGQ
ncbi:MAG TPA: GTPase [Chloroflexota bacterium]|nr:GTPase [Chloroflexota bacterium]